MKREKLERAIRIQEYNRNRRKNVAEYFLNFSKSHLPWLQELAERYKNCGEFPMIPMVILPSYYEDAKDKEVAVFAALLLKEDGDFGRIQAFKTMLGESPWEWFEKREFVKLSLGTVQNERTGGVEGWKIAKVFDKLWKECHITDYEITNFDNPWKTYKQSCVSSIGNMVKAISKTQRCSLFDVLTYLLEDCGVGNYFYKLRLLLQVLGTSDGIGIGLWDVGAEDLKCPIAAGLKDFVKMWFPDFGRAGDIDHAIRLFGFDRECDFFYAWMGYKELQKRNPEGCSLYATRYMSWYQCGSMLHKFFWRRIQPKIPF
jgi:hypothetical protein